MAGTQKRLKRATLMTIRDANGGHQFIHAGQEPYLSTTSLHLNKLLNSKKTNSKKEEKQINIQEKGDISTLDGRGIALGFRHQIEKNDPNHRPWRNGFYTEELGEVLNTWKETKTDDNLFDWANQNYPETQKYHVLYLTPEQADRYLATRNQSNQLIHASQNDKAIDDDNQDYIYAMDLNGNLFIGPEGPIDPKKPNERLQHPSFTQGDRVLCAGKLQIKNGKVTYIDNESGHYLPGGFSLSRLVDELEARGVLSENVKINVRGQAIFHNKGDKHGNLTLEEFRDVIRVWPGSALAKLDLSEKPRTNWFDVAANNFNIKSYNYYNTAVKRAQELGAFSRAVNEDDTNKQLDMLLRRDLTADNLLDDTYYFAFYNRIMAHNNLDPVRNRLLFVLKELRSEQETLQKNQLATKSYLKDLKSNPIKTPLLKTQISVIENLIAVNKTKECTKTKLDNFHQILNENKKLLRQNPDHAFIKFIKALGVIAAGILGVGMGGVVAYNHFFKKNEAFVKSVDELPPRIAYNS